MKSYSSREVLEILVKEGWTVKATRGDHWQLTHPNKPGKVTIRHPKKDLGIRDLKSIENQAGIKLS